MLLAIFGIDGGALSLIVNLLVLFLVVVYLSLIYWTYLDARRRLDDPVLIACATAASVFPFIGTVVYTILRPPEFREDREERDLELRAAELRLRQLIEQSCPHCEYPIQGSYLRCPNCERRLRNPCRRCHKPLDPKWGICPYCETEVRRKRPAAAGERETTRRSEREAAGRRSEREAARRSERATRAARSGSTERPKAPTTTARSADGPRRQSAAGQSRPKPRPASRPSR
ncbi:MAG TPA: zinc ribbon domain-containing protein [Solirubrobacterales bacterium]|nr:zinc ribbon domain-containing protein [Solirubrobacterales bacterium]